jgi:elongation factor 1-gamma
MKILHIKNILNIDLPLESINLEEKEKRNSLVQRTPTTTFPFLETSNGNISQSTAIIYYLCQKYKQELLGENPFEKGKIMQWIEFANCEILRCNKSIIYPIFGWSEFIKEDYDKNNNKLKEYLRLMDKNLEKNEFIVGNNLTLADIELFNSLRFLMMFHLPEALRKKLIPNLNKWFEKIMNTKEAIEAYGRTVLCKNMLKPFSGKICKKNLENINDNKIEKRDKEEKDSKDENKGKKNKKEKKDKKEKQGNKKDNEQKDNNKQDEIKKEKEPYVPGLLELPRFNIQEIENNPLDSLPESKFDLDKFKSDFINNSNKKGAMRNFWKAYDPEGYSLWYIEYNNAPNECVTLFRTCVIKGDILEQLKYFKKYCFGVLGAYGGNGDYKIKGCMLWRGNEIPQEIKNINCYDKMTFKKLDYNQKRDQQLVHDYWTKIGEKEKVFKKYAVDARYFY